MTKQQEDMQLIALDFIAAMTYQTKLNIDCLDKKVMNLRPSPLKDKVLYFVQNQKDWLRKLMAALDKIGIAESMQRDLDGVELDYYCIITEFARKTIDMKGAANIMEAVSECKEITDQMQQSIIQILNQHKNGNTPNQ